MIDIIPKESRVSFPLSPSLAKVLALGFLGSVVASGFGTWALLRGVNEEIAQTERAIQGSRTDEIRGLERDILSAERKLRDGERIMRSRKSPDGALLSLEDGVHPNVVFRNFLWSKAGGKIILVGEAASFRDLEEQMRIFNERNAFRDAVISHVGIGGEKGVSFEIEAETRDQETP